MSRKAKAIYVMESDVGLVKLGISEDPEARAKTIRTSTGFGLKLVHSTIARIDAKAVEFAAHKLLADKRKTGEWFDVSPDEAISAIREAVDIIESRAKARQLRPGRPLKYGEPLVRIQVLVRADQRKEAEKEATKRGVSVSEVYRDWIDAGRK